MAKAREESHIGNRREAKAEREKASRESAGCATKLGTQQRNARGKAEVALKARAAGKVVRKGKEVPTA